MSSGITTKAQRLDTKGVALVMSQGRAIQSGSFLLKVVKNSSTEPLSAAFISPKKAFKTAVSRNNAKRIGRAVFSRLLKGYSPKAGFQLAFVLRLPVVQRDFESLVAEMEQVLLKNDIIEPHSIHQ